MKFSMLTSLKVCVVAAALALSIAATGCSDCPSSNPAAGQPASVASDTASSNSPEEVARRALQAMIDGNSQGFLQEVRPDRRELNEILTGTINGLQGCQIDDDKTVVEVDGSDARVYFVFQRSCGRAFGVVYANKSCSVSLEKLTASGSTRWFLPYNNVDCAADLDTGP